MQGRAGRWGLRHRSFVLRPASQGAGRERRAAQGGEGSCSAAGRHEATQPKGTEGGRRGCVGPLAGLDSLQSTKLQSDTAAGRQQGPPRPPGNEAARAVQAGETGSGTTAVDNGRLERPRTRPLEQPGLLLPSPLFTFASGSSAFAYSYAPRLSSAACRAASRVAPAAAAPAVALLASSTALPLFACALRHVSRRVRGSRRK